MTAAPGLNPDFLDLLQALQEQEVEFLVVGAHAMAVHGVPRATGDLDLLVRPSNSNAARLWTALESFGAPLEVHGVTRSDFETPGTVYQIGLPPRRIDLLTSVSGLDFDEAWASRKRVAVDGIELLVLGRDALIRNKKASGREKDLLDVRLLEEG